jgi:hypothetical protein
VEKSKRGRIHLSISKCIEHEANKIRQTFPAKSSTENQAGKSRKQMKKGGEDYLQGVGVVDISFEGLERPPEGQRPAAMEHDSSRTRSRLLSRLLHTPYHELPSL